MSSPVTKFPDLNLYLWLSGENVFHQSDSLNAISDFVGICFPDKEAPFQAASFEPLSAPVQSSPYFTFPLSGRPRPCQLLELLHSVGDCDLRHDNYSPNKGIKSPYDILHYSSRIEKAPFVRIHSPSLDISFVGHLPPYETLEGSYWYIYSFVSPLTQEFRQSFSSPALDEHGTITPRTRSI